MVCKTTSILNGAKRDNTFCHTNFIGELQFRDLLVSRHSCYARYQSLVTAIFCLAKCPTYHSLSFCKKQRANSRFMRLLTNKAMITVPSARSLKAWSLVPPLPDFNLDYFKIVIQLSKMLLCLYFDWLHKKPIKTCSKQLLANTICIQHKDQKTHNKILILNEHTLQHIISDLSLYANQSSNLQSWYFDLFVTISCWYFGIYCCFTWLPLFIA